MRLGVNIDHVATLRQARRGRYPDPVAAAAIAELAGAEQITLHVREDRRHVNDRDLAILRLTVNGALNLEMAATQAMLAVALEHRPDTVTLVPEKREELTTEGGLDVVRHFGPVEEVVRGLRGEGGPGGAAEAHGGEGAAHRIEVSLFIDPEPAQIEASARLGAEAVELHTGRFCDERSAEKRAGELQRLQAAARHAAKLGLRVAAGHGLDYWNVQEVARIPEVTELNIGYSIVCRAVLVGLERAVRDMKALIG
jgi:pyridoxine 5-phosphate synthase